VFGLICRLIGRMMHERHRADLNAGFMRGRHAHFSWPGLAVMILPIASVITIILLQLSSFFLTPLAESGFKPSSQQRFRKRHCVPGFNISLASYLAGAVKYCLVTISRVIKYNSSPTGPSIKQNSRQGITKPCFTLFLRASVTIKYPVIKSKAR
jgi:hypothetical protein